MTIQHLTGGDFALSGRTLMCNVPGIVFVLFTSSVCQLSKQTMPIFEQLSQKDNRLMWATVDAMRYRNISQLSKNSTTLIKATPMLILYVNGRPHVHYKGSRNAQNIKDFLNRILPSINTTKSFVPQQIQPASNPYPQPTYQPQTGGQQQPMTDMSRVDDLQMPPSVVPHNEPWKPR